MPHLLAPCLAGAVVLASCAAAGRQHGAGAAPGDPTEPEPPATADATTAATTAADADDGEPADRDDGILRIGLLLPQTGAGAELGLPANNAAELAISRINETSPYNGAPVELVKADEGADAQSASAAVDELLAQGVDAIVGPGSSTIAVQVLDQITGAGVLACSPTASTALLDRHPDRDGLFFRTIPSESGQMAALAYSASREGVPNAVVLYRDDEYGQGLRRAATRYLEGQGLTITDEIALATTDTEFDEAIERVAADSAGSTIVVLSDAEQGMQVMDAIARHVDDLGGDDLPKVLVNEAITASDPAVYATWPAPLVAKWVRYAPVAQIPGGGPPAPPSPDGSTPTTEADPDRVVPEGPFALNTFDCVNLIALSAIESSDDPSAIAREMYDIADGGFPCDTYAACVARIEDNLDIDYNGINPANAVKAFNDAGDPARTTVMTYILDPTRFVEIEGGTVLAGAG